MKKEMPFNLEEQSEILVERFQETMKNSFGALIVLWSIEKRKRASSKEIKEDLRDFFRGGLEYNYTSFYRLLSRLRDDFKLIKEVEREKAKGPERIYYSLTPLGKLVLKKTISRCVTPLKNLT